MAVAARDYDIILMDPPSFSTTARGRFTTRGGTSDLAAKALPLLNEGGLLVASSNHQKVDVADYLKELRRGALQAGSDLQGHLAEPASRRISPIRSRFPRGGI